jgi:aconitate hydratase
VLTVTQMLRKRGVVGKFVEYFGPGLASLTIADRATLGNMAPEYGATCGFFPDRRRHHPLSARHRPLGGPRRAGHRLCQGAGHVPHQERRPIRSSPTCSSSNCRPSSRRSPDRSGRRTAWRSKRSRAALPPMDKEFGKAAEMDKRVPVEAASTTLGHGDVVIAAITSCTNTSNPSVMIGPGFWRARRWPRA